MCYIISLYFECPDIRYHNIFYVYDKYAVLVANM